jgi:hypothetical protein
MMNRPQATTAAGLAASLPALLAAQSLTTFVRALIASASVPFHSTEMPEHGHWLHFQVK